MTKYSPKIWESFRYLGSRTLEPWKFCISRSRLMEKICSASRFSSFIVKESLLTLQNEISYLVEPKHLSKVNDVFEFQGNCFLLHELKAKLIIVT